METQRGATELIEAGEASAVQLPEAWIGTAADYAADRTYGDWIDMSGEARGVMTAIRSVIDGTPRDTARDWRICELRGFGGWQPSEHDGLVTVLEIARGVVMHGPAYGALAAKLGADHLALRYDKYPVSYIGAWPSVDAFVDTVARESGWYERLTRLPSGMRPYVRLDTSAMAADAARDLTVIEHPDGVWLYDPRCW